MNCSICFGEAADHVGCSRGEHAICGDCVEAMLKSLARDQYSDVGPEYLDPHGMPCPADNDCDGRLAYAELGSILPTGAAAAGHVAGLMRAAAAAQEQTLRQRFNSQRRVNPATHDALVQYVDEWCLEASCPNCNAAFLDWNGCNAVTCHRSYCGQKFCAICLAAGDSAQEVHRHVVRVHRDYFAKVNDPQGTHLYALLNRLDRHMEVVGARHKVRRQIRSYFKRQIEEKYPDYEVDLRGNRVLNVRPVPPRRNALNRRRLDVDMHHFQNNYARSFDYFIKAAALTIGVYLVLGILATYTQMGQKEQLYEPIDQSRIGDLDYMISRRDAKGFGSVHRIEKEEHDGSTISTSYLHVPTMDVPAFLPFGWRVSDHDSNTTFYDEERQKRASFDPEPSKTEAALKDMYGWPGYVPFTQVLRDLLPERLHEDLDSLFDKYEHQYFLIRDEFHPMAWEAAVFMWLRMNRPAPTFEIRNVAKLMAWDLVGYHRPIYEAYANIAKTDATQFYLWCHAIFDNIYADKPLSSIPEDQRNGPRDLTLEMAREYIDNTGYNRHKVCAFYGATEICAE